MRVLTQFDGWQSIIDNIQLPMPRRGYRLTNPFTLQPVTEAAYFETIRREVVDSILPVINRDGMRPECFSIIGERRFGKTSLLRYLNYKTVTNPNIISIVIDMLNLESLTPEGFYKLLTESFIEMNIVQEDHPTLDFRSLK